MMFGVLATGTEGNNFAPLTIAMKYGKVVSSLFVGMPLWGSYDCAFQNWGSFDVTIFVFCLDLFVILRKLLQTPYDIQRHLNPHTNYPPMDSNPGRVFICTHLTQPLIDHVLFI